MQGSKRDLNVFYVLYRHKGFMQVGVSGNKVYLIVGSEEKGSYKKEHIRIPSFRKPPKC